MGDDCHAGLSTHQVPPDCISTSGRPRRAPWVNLFRDNERSLRIESSRSNTVHQLDSVGALIWDLCDGSRSLRQIQSLLTDAYPEGDQVDRDVEQLLNLLLDQQLLVVDGGEAAMEYLGESVRKLKPTSSLLANLDIIRNHIFEKLRVTELGELESDLASLLGEEALVLAKQRDTDFASSDDFTTIPFDGGLQSEFLATAVSACENEIREMIPEVSSSIELSGNAVYLRGAHMGWHSNHSRSDGRVYCSWSEIANQNFFRYEDPRSAKMVTLYEKAGWNIKSFTIPPAHTRFWHCIGAGSLRLSIGFRYSLPGI